MECQEDCEKCNEYTRQVCRHWIAKKLAIARRSVFDKEQTQINEWGAE